MARLEMAAPVEPAKACPRAGRAGPLKVEEEFSWFLW